LTQAEIRKLLTWLAVALGAGCLACLAISFAFSPESIAAGEPLRAVGLPVRKCSGCGLCGLSRGFALFSDGRVAAAAALNPAVLVLYPSFWIAAVGGPALALLRTRGARTSRSTAR